MTLRQYIDELNELAQSNPECLDMDVIYARDDEGNGFQKVHWGPNKGYYEDMEFIPADQLEDYDREESDINAICIN